MENKAENNSHLFLWPPSSFDILKLKHELDITTWSIVSILFKRSMNSLLSAFSAKSWPPSKSVGTLTWPISSRQLKIYFLASLDLIPVSASCSSGVFNRQNGYVPVINLNQSNYVQMLFKNTEEINRWILLRTVHVSVKEFCCFAGIVQHVFRWYTLRLTYISNLIIFRATRVQRPP